MIYNHKNHHDSESAEAQIKFCNLRKLGIQSGAVNKGIGVRGDKALADKRQNLFSNQILSALPESDFARLLPFLEITRLSPDESLCQPGETLRYFYFPKSVVVSYLHVLADGDSTEIAMTGCESVVGLPEIFGSHSSPYSTQVTIPGIAWRIKAEILRKEFWRGEALQKILVDNLNAHLMQISQKAACNTHHQVEPRFCTWLLMLQDRIQSNELTLTQDQIARYLGVHRPSITHIAQALRHQGIISYIRSHITILNRRGLEENACECYLTLKEPTSFEFAETIQ